MAPNASSAWKLAIEDDEGQTTSLDLAHDAYAIGRAEDNDIRLTERNVSRRHAQLRNTSEGWELLDAGSYNGTHVNGERISGEGVLLSSGDVVNIGDYRIELLDASEQVVDLEEELSRQRRPDRLVVVIGPSPGIEYALDGDRLMMGRAEDVAVSINHASVSRHHAELVNLGHNRWEVIDQGSSNGIRINGVELRRGIIEPGDALELGDVRLRFVAAGKYFRPAVDLSQQLPAMPFEGMTSPSPSSSTPRNVGTIVAALAIIGLLVVAGGYAMFSGDTNANPAAPSAPMAETDEEARQYLDRALQAANEGDIEGAHAILQKIPESSSSRETAEYRELEDRWAETMFDKAEATGDVEKKIALYNAVADATTVSTEKRQLAADKAFELDPDEGKKRRRPPGLRPPPLPRPSPPPTDIYPQPSESEPKAGDKPEPQPPAKFDQKSAKQNLLSKLQSGTATETELRMLKAICMTDGDRTCRNAAVAALKAKQQQNK